VFARERCCSFCTVRVVEPCLLFLESFLSLVELTEASILLFAVAPGLRGVLR
jgi:hypothetical protein